MMFSISASLAYLNYSFLFAFFFPQQFCESSVTAFPYTEVIQYVLFE